MNNNYDNAASFYDRLSLLVFGNTLVKAQVYLLKFIPPSSRVLIVGGGTGWILEELTKVHPQDLHITYVELSAKMLSRTRKRTIADNEVRFIHSAIEDVRFFQKFDVIITPFLFDSFSEPTLEEIFAYLHQQLKPGGLWLYADFKKTNVWWQQVVLKTMLVFFKLICNIEAGKLPDVERQFALRNYTKTEEESFFDGFIVATVYQ